MRSNRADKVALRAGDGWRRQALRLRQQRQISARMRACAARWASVKVSSFVNQTFGVDPA